MTPHTDPEHRIGFSEYVRTAMYATITSNTPTRRYEKNWNVSNSTFLINSKTIFSLFLVYRNYKRISMKSMKSMKFSVTSPLLIFFRQFSITHAFTAIWEMNNGDLAAFFVSWKKSYNYRKITDKRKFYCPIYTF